MKIIILYFCLFIISFCDNIDISIQKPKTYNGNENITGWFMSEKLDGIRGYWNGKELLTRKGKRISTPIWFIKNYPNFELDGELYTKRAEFEHIQSIVMDQKPGKYWYKITYNIFEVPNAKGDFQTRLNKAKKWFKQNPNKNVKIIDQIEIKNKEHLNFFLERIISKKGEGVIVKDPTKDFHTGRSPHILKIKKSADMEGKVIGINISHKTGVLKSLIIELENKIVFNLGIGFNDKQRKNPPKIGEIVTFKYYGLTKNSIPKFASFLHIRKD